MTLLSCKVKLQLYGNIQRSVMEKVQGLLQQLIKDGDHWGQEYDKCKWCIEEQVKQGKIEQKTCRFER